MIDYLTHYYKRGRQPFQTLSALPEEEAIRIMQGLYEETVFGSRFKEPAQYLRDRKQAEQWVRQQFIEKGGCPVEDHPVYMVLGSSSWINRHALEGEEPIYEVRLPLSVFQPGDVSFTYPDSMISLWFGTDQPAEYYLPDYHGKVFTLPEILHIVEEHGVPEECWNTHLPDDLAPYIEAQVWNFAPLQFRLSKFEIQKRKK